MFPPAVLIDCICRMLYTGGILKASTLHAWGGTFYCWILTSHLIKLYLSLLRIILCFACCDLRRDMKQVYLFNYTSLLCSADACFSFLPIQWMETGRCGVSGLCAVRNASIWEFGNVLRHLQETEESTARAWVKSRRIALKGFAFKVSNGWHWIRFRSMA